MAIILVASEDLACMLGLSAAIEGLGHTALPVSSASDVLEQALSNEVDLAILDECMGMFDGFELSAMLRSDPGIPPRLPILLIASRGISPRKIEQAGITDWFHKECESGEVIDRLIMYLGDAAPRPSGLILGPDES